MRFSIKHDIPGRIRIHFMQERMTFEQADTLQYFLDCLDGVKQAKVYERTADAVISYTESRETLIAALSAFRYENVDVPAEVLSNSGREMNAYYQEKLVMKVV